MTITPVFFRIELPESKKIYGDTVKLFDKSGSILFECRCRTSPNAIQPKTGRDWQHVYALICPGVYDYKSIKHEIKFGRCLIVNQGGVVPTSNFNIKHGANYAKEIFVHKGFSLTCSGSAGCLTIHPEDMGHFINHFPLNTSGKIYLTEDMNFTPPKEIKI